MKNKFTKTALSFILALAMIVILFPVASVPVNAGTIINNGDLKVEFTLSHSYIEVKNGYGYSDGYYDARGNRIDLIAKVTVTNTRKEGDGAISFNGFMINPYGSPNFPQSYFSVYGGLRIQTKYLSPGQSQSYEFSVRIPATSQAEYDLIKNKCFILHVTTNRIESYISEPFAGPTVKFWEAEKPLEMRLTMNSYDITWAKVNKKATAGEMIPSLIFGVAFGVIASPSIGTGVSIATAIYQLWENGIDGEIVNAIQPKSLILTVEIENPNPKTITLDNVNVDLSNAFSDLTSKKLSKTSLSYFNGLSIKANEKVRLEHMIFPDFDVIVQTPPVEIKAKCYYQNTDKKSVTVEANTSPIKFTQRPLQADPVNDQQNWQQQRKHFAIECPVDVNILDTKGNLLATVKNGDENIAEIDGLVAYAVGETKYISVPLNKLSDFRIQLQATDKGKMDIASFDFLDESINNLAAFINVPLVKGELFEMDLQSGKAAKLFEIGKNGTSVEIPSILDDLLPDGGEYDDVPKEAWFYDSVRYVTDNGQLFDPTAPRIFSPNEPTTRLMLAEALYRMEGRPEVTETNPFADTDAPSVIWANKSGIVMGMGDGKFAPDVLINREQMAVLLFRFIQYKQYKQDNQLSGDLSVFTDADGISPWAEDAVKWAVGCGLFRGRADGIFAPQDTATRAEVVTLLMRFIEMTDIK
ncbi:hypothetical protein FACS1894219_10370 [Clostridia bacterium]|nr:hypothetical protein FACS1894219_10370 [Clostridia bacterium]